MLNILHTSDWHLGRTLYGRKRYDEFSALLTWLLDIINQQEIDVLLIAGDIFDTTTPSNKAQTLYYQFLSEVAKTCCEHVVIIAGNHDSPTLLNASQLLLKSLNIHVVGHVCKELNDEVIVLRDKSQKPQAVICAVPYLRDKDIRSVSIDESIEDKHLKLQAGIKYHYQQVCQIAKDRQQQLATEAPNTVIPIIGMGHLFAAGGKTVEGDGVRELYVGSLAHVHASIFPDSLDYVALGHLHVAQRVNQCEYIRYSGSPLPMGYGEAKQQKQMLKVTFSDTAPVIEEIVIPTFQTLVRISGSLDVIESQIQTLKENDSDAWLEIVYIGDDIMPNLRELIESWLIDSQMEVSRIKNQRIIDNSLMVAECGETLDDLTVDDVFKRCLLSHNVTEQEQALLCVAFKQAVDEIGQEIIDENT